MRNRLAAAFLLLAVLVLALFAAVRLTTQYDLIRDRETAHLERDARVLAKVVDTWTSAGTPLERAQVTPLLEGLQEATLQVGSGAPVTLTGDAFTPATGKDALMVRASSGAVSVTLRQSPDVVRATFRDIVEPMLALSVVLVFLAGVLGYLVSGLLSAPFRRLALAAGALARGRSDLDLPTSRIPEVRALADALAASAARLQREGRRDQEFLKDASHRLRTPMTGMRLELEELQQRTDLEPDVRATVDRSVDGLDHLQELTTGIFALARAARGGFGEVQVTTQELAQQTANGWAPVLRERGVDVKVHADGSLDEPLTPGPFEQVLDLVLADLVQTARGTVHVAIAASGQQVSVHVRCDAAVADPAAGRPTLGRVLAMVDLLGGRSTGDPAGTGLRVWLPLG